MHKGPADRVRNSVKAPLGGPINGFDDLDSTNFRTRRRYDASLLRLFESLRKNLAEKRNDLSDRTSLRLLVRLPDHRAGSSGVVLEGPAFDTG